NNTAPSALSTLSLHDALPIFGADTVDTIPPATFDAFRDHGRLRPSLTENVERAAKTMADLAKAGISMKEVTDKLMIDGVKLFAEDRKSTRLNSSHQIISYAVF